MNAQRIRACLEVLEDRRLLSFAPAVDYAGGTNPQEIAAADFNNDGRLDLVVANPAANSVNVLLGNGNGTFQSPLSSAAGANPRSIAVGDFNADGKLDLAAVGDDSYGNSGVNVMRGNGNGTFAAPNDVAYGLEGTQSVATGDFNNDGKLDLVVTSNPSLYYYPYQGQIDVLLGYGDGGFTPRAYATVDRLGSVVVADMNGDGNRDIVIEMPERPDSLVQVVLGDGRGNLRGGGLAYSQAPSAAADLTGDGKTDVVVAGGLLRGNGAGGFVSDVPEQFQTGGSGPGSVALGDFDRDGHLDIAKTDSIVRDAGNGTFSSEPYVPAPGPSAAAVAAGDFNDDGWLDAATANSAGNTVSVLLNDRNWGVAPPTISISDAAMIIEGSTGTVNATFTVTLSKPSTTAVTVDYATADIFATAGSDYVAKTGRLTIPAGQTSGTFTVAVIGDRIVESTSEEFSVQLSSATNATIANARATGRILDDEPRINIGNVTKSEGRRGTTTFSFTVSLSNAYDQAVTVNYATANGTATAGSDYQARSGSVTFAPGETTKTITIVVKGDRAKESNETFFVDLFGVGGNAVIAAARGTGTILNDDDDSRLLR